MFCGRNNKTKGIKDLKEEKSQTMFNGIAQLENREFTSSTGNWNGDIVWDPGPIFGLYGLGKIITDPSPTIATACLVYPYSKVRHRRDTRLTINIAKPLGYALCRARLRLSDGVLSYVASWKTLVLDFSWDGLGLPQTIPGLFNILNTSIFIDVQSLSLTLGTTVFIDFASIAEVSHKDYLPVVGVG